MSQDSTYAFPYSTKNQHLHTSAQTSLHHQYTPQQNQFSPPQDSLIAPTPTGTPNPQYTTSQNTTIATPSLGTRRYKAPQLTSIAPTSNTPNRQYSSTHPSIAPPLNGHPPSPISTQCLPTTNNVPTISSSLPASLPTPPAGLPSPTAATTFDLQDIIMRYGTQPEILKDILAAKVEEDKRKTEEARMRIKELDLMILERDRQRKCIDHVDESKNDEIHSNQDVDYDNDNSIGAFDGSISYASFNTSLSSPVQNLTLNSPSSTPVSQSTPRLKSAPRLNSTPKAIQNDQEGTIESTENGESNINCTPNKRKRKRREMLPVTMIIETKTYPYEDDYLWKNNGNTTQRKTGNKSVYFKCSNSSKGCPVNKTVTQREGGWIIKYRGSHLDGCGKVIKRVLGNTTPVA